MQSSKFARPTSDCKRVFRLARPEAGYDPELTMALVESNHRNSTQSRCLVDRTQRCPTTSIAMRPQYSDRVNEEWQGW